MKKLRMPVFPGFAATLAVLVSLSDLQAFDEGLCLDMWEIKQDSLEVVSVQAVPRDYLPIGLTGLDMLMLDEPEDGSMMALIGYGDYETLLGTAPFDMLLNPAKTSCYFSESDSLIILSSQYPDRATTNHASYRWIPGTDTLLVVDTWKTDRSAALLEASDSLLAVGRIREAADSIEVMFYGWAYYDERELCCRFLRAAHAASMAARDEGMDDLALDHYDAMLYAFGVIQYDEGWFLEFDSLDQFLESEYALYMGAEEFLTILQDYNDLLEDNGVGAYSVLRDAAETMEAGME
ncbi:MAG: hypothetical protein GF388_04905 [Candidatus Aegiribacteria sp.]|nr:hypothetical protein [Candidatus Aegiribacteria sp.]MBD3294559.1 hypothetical protein [Candidatus Fermentibacteria bacterium]